VGPKVRKILASPEVFCVRASFSTEGRAVEVVLRSPEGKEGKVLPLNQYLAERKVKGEGKQLSQKVNSLKERIRDREELSSLRHNLALEEAKFLEVVAPGNVEPSILKVLKMNRKAYDSFRKEGETPSENRQTIGGSGGEKKIPSPQDQTQK